MAATEDVLTEDQVDAALRGLPDWRYRLGGLVTVYKAPAAAAALELIAAVGRLAEEQNHHPDLDWRYNRVFLRYSSHDAGDEVTRRDVAAAAAAGAAAAGIGATAEPGLYRTIEVVIDSEDPAAISEVWRVALGYRRGGSDDLVDPFGRGPTLWFQQTSTPSPSRLHLDIHRSKAESGPVLEKTAATGALMNRDHAPNWVVVTDTQGNQLCLCTEAGTGSEVPEA
ncbi:4a-hydroxytetrahydrobiopterin dehydratase [Arthrobacter sp. U41]|uniref:4a-hydroxytetrahydrobiopterin dehydratase n=1 Tax=Arthrobacter sp. U41 TaxID=1849032 RepID=UPI000859443F|nr:4a-hydroxytetrahydrobiopterin dehydratase [Arthrobacter sp. U41]AOT05225.1 pterin-4-alpha-carbinolamine dehydratase [Arthrobacter sp. U41]